MVKPIDINKLDGVKKAAIRVIVERGYYGATIAQISKEAGVSDGYLYRHYSGKAALVLSLYIEQMTFFQQVVLDAIKREPSVKGVLLNSFKFLNETVQDDKDTIAFVFIMDHDHSFSFPNEIRSGFRIIGGKLQKLGVETKEISSSRNIEEIIAVVFGLPIKLIEMRRKAIIKSESISTTDINMLVDICLKALR